MKNFVKGKISQEKEYKKYKEDGICGCCGSVGIWKDVISPNFNSFEEFSGDGVCEECIPLFHSDFRKKNFYITETEAKTIKQNEFFDILHNIRLPCILSFTDSNKKHRLFRGKISREKERACIVLDDSFLWLDLTVDLDILDRLDNFYKKYKVSKEWIEFGTYPVGAVKKFDFSEFMELESIVKPMRGGEKLKYLLKFCNKE